MSFTPPVKFKLFRSIPSASLPNGEMLNPSVLRQCVPSAKCPHLPPAESRADTSPVPSEPASVLTVSDSGPVPGA